MSQNTTTEFTLNNPVHKCLYQFWNSAILRAGVKLNLFMLIEKNKSSTAQDISELLTADHTFTESFLEACVVIGLIEKDQDRYRNTKETSATLVPSSPNYIGDFVLHITNHWNSWGNLDKLVIDGQTEPPFENGFVDTPTYWRDYMYGQHNRSESGQSANLVKSIDLTDRHKLLDLGGGIGSYSIALCKANAELHADIVDQKEPLEMARDLINESKLADRISLIEGDFNNIELGTDYDVVLISGVVCIKSPKECRAVFQRAYNALLPNGIVIVQDFMRLDHSHQRNDFDTMMNLYLKLAFDPGANDYEGKEVISWLTEVGFVENNPSPLPTQLGIITARKPS